MERALGASARNAMKPRTPRKKLSIAPSVAAVRAARKLLARHFPMTRLVPAPFLAKESGKHIYLKLESELPTGSFKVRGALWALANQLKKPRVREVIASSTGNHGAAVAFAAKLLGLKARVFLPANCNPVKRARIAALRAEIVESGGSDLAAAFALASEYATRPGVYFLNDATDPNLPAGPATIGVEILEQLPRVNSIIVPMGDTALIRGIAAATKQLAPRVKVVGVQAERAPSYYLSWKENRVVGTETCDTIADGLATRTPDAANVHDIRNLVDDVVLVTEDEMLRAIATLLFEEHVLAEPAGAASTAALLKARANYGEHVALIVSGANISRDVLKHAVDLIP